MVNNDRARSFVFELNDPVSCNTFSTVNRNCISIQRISLLFLHIPIICDCLKGFKKDFCFKLVFWFVQALYFVPSKF